MWMEMLIRWRPRNGCDSRYNMILQRHLPSLAIVDRSAFSSLHEVVGKVLNCVIVEAHASIIHHACISWRVR